MKRLKFQVWALVFAALLVTAGCTRDRAANRSDQEIAQDVQSRISADANLPNKNITVNANNGTVTLSGTVATETERLTASNDASTVPGVKQVVNNLTVAPTLGAAATDLPSNQNIGTTPAAAPKRTPAAPKRATTTRGTGGTGPIGNESVASNVAERTTPAVTQVTVPDGTNVTILTNDTISSETAEVGTRFTGVIDDPIYADNEIAVPRNANVEGRVVAVKSAGKFKGQSELVLELTSLSYNGRNYPISTSQWTKKGSSRGKNTAAKVGGGAAIGAAIGAIAGGGKGAAIGAGIGAGAGTAAQAVTKGQQIELKPETMLTFTLESPVKVVPATTAARR